MTKPVLVYHHIKNGYKRGMTPKQFEEQFMKLKDTHIFTFDDGLKEHFTVAFPLLKQYEVTGYFFPIGETLEGTFNHVHKAHILLDMFEEEFIELYKANGCYFDDDRQLLDVKYVYDSPKTARFKKYLTTASVEYKNLVFDRILEHKKISLPKTEDYCLTKNELKQMSDAGMVIGNHSWTHPNLSLQIKQRQHYEIGAAGFAIWEAAGKPAKTISYPYGAYNNDTLELMKTYRVTLGFTTDTETKSPLETGRLDCKEAI